MFSGNTARVLLALLSLLLIGTKQVLAEDDEHNESAESTVFILFLFFGLLVGILIFQFLSNYGEIIPYTCVVFILGIIIATIDGAYSAGEDYSYTTSISFLFPLTFMSYIFVYLLQTR